MLAAARERAVRRVLTVGLGEDSIPRSSPRHGKRKVFASVGRHPNGATGFDQAAAEAISCSVPSRGVVAVGETGLDFYRDGADPDDQRRAFSAQLAIARRANKPVVIHLRDQDGAEDAVAEAFRTLTEESDGTDVILHCFSMGPSWAERAAERGWYCSFAGNLTYPKSRRSARRPGSSPRTACWSRPTRRFFRRSPSGKPNQPANVVATPLSGSPRSMASLTVSSSAPWATHGSLRVVRSRRPARSSRRLGQNFLADPNLLETIVREADLAATVVLEVGGGGGALSERLAPAVAVLHLVELDERLRRELGDSPTRRETSSSSGVTRCESISPI